MALRLHLFVCALCRTYEKQIAAVCGISRRAGTMASSHAPSLPPQRRQTIQDALRRD